ncbi:hypothetical protein ACLOJK_027820 [Asimina triloba]
MAVRLGLSGRRKRNVRETFEQDPRPNIKERLKIQTSMVSSEGCLVQRWENGGEFASGGDEVMHKSGRQASKKASTPLPFAALRRFGTKILILWGQCLAGASLYPHSNRHVHVVDLHQRETMELLGRRWRPIFLLVVGCLFLGEGLSGNSRVGEQDNTAVTFGGLNGNDVESIKPNVPHFPRKNESNAGNSFQSTQLKILEDEEAASVVALNNVGRRHGGKGGGNVVVVEEEVEEGVVAAMDGDRVPEAVVVEEEAAVVVVEEEVEEEVVVEVVGEGAKGGVGEVAVEVEVEVGVGVGVEVEVEVVEGTWVSLDQDAVVKPMGEQEELVKPRKDTDQAMGS